MNQAGILWPLLRLVPHGHLVFSLISCSSLGSWLSFPFSFQPANGQEKPETSLFRFLMGARCAFPWRQEPDEVSVLSPLNQRLEKIFQKKPDKDKEC